MNLIVKCYHYFFTKVVGELGALVTHCRAILRCRILMLNDLVLYVNNPLLNAFKYRL